MKRRPIVLLLLLAGIQLAIAPTSAIKFEFGDPDISQKPKDGGAEMVVETIEGGALAKHATMDELAISTSVSPPPELYTQAWLAQGDWAAKLSTDQLESLAWVKTAAEQTAALVDSYLARTGLAETVLGEVAVDYLKFLGLDEYLQNVLDEMKRRATARLGESAAIPLAAIPEIDGSLGQGAGGPHAPRFGEDGSGGLEEPGNFPMLVVVVIVLFIVILGGGMMAKQG